LLSDIYYPAWKCYVDDNETEIFRADYSLRAVFLSKGKHTVRFVYDSSFFSYGKYISIISLILCAGILSFSFIRKSHGRKHEEDKSSNI
ncbi:MAG TPA: hypothetical protein VJ455_12170, partial [Ignavibacteria bacterium]|nr:hypothetical protein [Ignavibacteria bacterium]